MQKLIKLFASAIVAALIVPFIQAPAIKLAEKIGFDTLYTKRWEASMAFLSDLAQNPWYIFACGCVIGLATALWVIWLFPEKRKEAEVSGAVASYTETRLRLRADPSGSRTLLQEMEINIDHWQQTIISLNSENNNLLHADTISMTFRQDTDYSRPIIDTFGHKVRRL